MFFSVLKGFNLTNPLSIWFYHAASSRQGENSELRLIFFRLARLLRYHTCLPIFVFDGPDRPQQKRGKKVPKASHWMVQGVKAMVTAFGFQWLQVS